MTSQKTEVMHMNSNNSTISAAEERLLREHLSQLRLPAFLRDYEETAKRAAHDQWSHMHYLALLAETELNLRKDRSVQRRIKQARFPVIKTIDGFDWNWPKKINRMQVQDLFRLTFIKQKGNVIFLGGLGLGKTHLSTALAYQACLMGHSALYASAIDIVNSLAAAQGAGRLKIELKRYLKPELLFIDELGYLPVDRKGADLLFQVISQRYEHGSIVLTTNKPFKKWPEIFNNDSTLTSAVLDRLLHHAETVVIEGKSYRMKDQIED
jgi:DNA replication protein DnaC